MQQIEYPRIVVVHIARAVIAQKVVKGSERFRIVLVATPIHDAQMLSGVGVEKIQAVFG